MASFLTECKLETKNESPVPVLGDALHHGNQETYFEVKDGEKSHNINSFSLPTLAETKSPPPQK
jgi:hypothetical protein